jgi:ribosomal protein L37AE/L43A
MRNQEEINRKISETLKTKYKPKTKQKANCLECGNEFEKRKDSSKYCCRSCACKNSMKNISAETREKLKQNAINRHKNKDGIRISEER